MGFAVNYKADMPEALCHFLPFLLFDEFVSVATPWQQHGLTWPEMPGRSEAHQDRNCGDSGRRVDRSWVLDSSQFSPTFSHIKTLRTSANWVVCGFIFSFWKKLLWWKPVVRQIVEEHRGCLYSSRARMPLVLLHFDGLFATAAQHVIIHMYHSSTHIP